MSAFLLVKIKKINVVLHAEKQDSVLGDGGFGWIGFATLGWTGLGYAG